MQTASIKKGQERGFGAQHDFEIEGMSFSTVRDGTANITLVQYAQDNAGFHFTNKLEGMFNDMAISAEVIQKFKHYSSEKQLAPNFDFVVQVLDLVLLQLLVLMASWLAGWLAGWLTAHRYQYFSCE
eukprot:SAG11_NODE_1299_length_5264_cov_5.517715_4_plen_127_part_00